MGRSDHPLVCKPSRLQDTHLVCIQAMPQKHLYILVLRFLGFLDHVSHSRTK